MIHLYVEYTKKRWVHILSVYIYHSHNILKVFEMNSVVLYDNPWLHLFLPVSSNFVLHHFKESYVVDSL